MSGSSNLLVRFLAFTRRHRLLPEGGKIIVAVSGGLDSVVLLHLLTSVREELGLSLLVAHLNHCLRGEDADHDEQFVARMADQAGIPFRVQRVDVAAQALQRRIGIEEAGREVRYGWFEELRNEHRFDAVATAHTADDNAETVLFHLVRGTGVRGLAGIPITRDNGRIIRPLLFASRQEIEAYAVSSHLNHREDMSNASTEWTRNFLRHQILPELKKRINPGMAQTLRRSSDQFRELDAYLEGIARTALHDLTERTDDGQLTLDVARLLAFPEVIRQRVAKLAIEELIPGGISPGHLHAVLDLLDLQPGSWTPLPDGRGVFRERNALAVRPQVGREQFVIRVEAGEHYACGWFAFSSEFGTPPDRGTLGTDRSVEYIDADQLSSGDLVLRSWRPGDTFIPLGMTGSKKLSDFFIDEQIPEPEKAHYPVLESSGTIVWVCGLRIDNRFRVRPTTTRVLRIAFSRTTEH